MAAIDDTSALRVKLQAAKLAEAEQLDDERHKATLKRISEAADVADLALQRGTRALQVAKKAAVGNDAIRFVQAQASMKADMHAAEQAEEVAQRNLLHATAAKLAVYERVAKFNLDTETIRSDLSAPIVMTSAKACNPTNLGVAFAQGEENYINGTPPPLANGARTPQLPR